MGVVKRAEVILMLAVGVSHRKVRQRRQVETIRPDYPQGPQAVNILASVTIWLIGFGIAWGRSSGVAGVQELQNGQAKISKKYP
jgi:hypothetical protein